jgi:hypothetical protein
VVITDSSDVGKAGVQRNKNTPPYPSAAGSPTSQFEDAGFASVQARISRSHASRRAIAGTGQAGTSSKAGLRGHNGISFVGAKGNSPKRGKGEPTAADANNNGRPVD